MIATLLAQVADALARGTLQVVDLTQPLGPATPVIELPPMFAASPGVTIDVISKYDAKGPAWCANPARRLKPPAEFFDFAAP